MAHGCDRGYAHENARANDHDCDHENAHASDHGYDRENAHGHFRETDLLAGTRHGGGECPLRRALGGF